MVIRKQSSRLYGWLTQLFRPRRAPTVRKTKAGFRLLVERLEDRIVPVTNTWQGGSADWNADPLNNWSQHHTPISTEDVEIVTNVTVTHSANSPDTPLGDVVNKLT